MQERMLNLTEVAEILNISREQARVLAFGREMPAFQVGRRGFWRVDPARLQSWIDEKHAARAGSARAGEPQREPPAADEEPTAVVDRGHRATP